MKVSIRTKRAKKNIAEKKTIILSIVCAILVSPLKCVHEDPLNDRVTVNFVQESLKGFTRIQKAQQHWK